MKEISIKYRVKKYGTWLPTALKVSDDFKPTKEALLALVKEKVEPTAVQAELNDR